MKTVFVAWQDPQTRRFVPVGRLTQENGVYKFAYTRGAEEAKNFTRFGAMQDLDVVYVSEKLFPLFANRLLPKSRPEYQQFLTWLGLDAKEQDELEMLARSGGQRATDSLEIIPCPEPTKDNNYVVQFFIHGLRYLRDKDQDRVSRLSVGDPLFLMRDVQNQHDPMALLMRTGDPISIVGYCPRYYSGEFSTLLEKLGPKKIKINVERVNQDAPSNFKLLCKLIAPWPADFSPFSREQFELVANRIKN